MKETKEMMIKLPMVTAASWEELKKAITYPQSGRYIVKMDNGDIVVADVTLRPVGQGEVRAIDEEVQSYCTCFVGQSVVLNPDEWVLATDLENVQNAFESKREQMEEELQETRERHEAEMAEQKAKCEAMCEETERNCKELIDKKDAELQYRIDTLNEANEQKLAMRRMELEQEYEKKKLQLELETPKRFAQGEWVSGKTLTEIVKALMCGKKEE